jgi:hypothetical protein
MKTPSRQMAGESLHRRETLKPGSARQFGFVMAGFFVLLTLIWAWSASWLLAALWLGIAVAFALAAVLAPRALEPLNRLWFRLGLVLHAIVNPLFLGAMFFGVMTPIGLLMRVLGKRPIPLGFDDAASSYWVARATPPGPMTKQY